MRLILFIVLSFFVTTLKAQSATTKRENEFENDKVKVWKTTIMPANNAKLTMHRHEHDRVLVALTDGKLKITNNVEKVHFLTLKKGQSYFLKKDIPNEMHSDENITSYPIVVTIIELKN